MLECFLWVDRARWSGVVLFGLGAFSPKTSTGLIFPHEDTLVCSERRNNEKDEWNRIEAKAINDLCHLFFNYLLFGLLEMNQLNNYINNIFISTSTNSCTHVKPKHVCALNTG